MLRQPWFYLAALLALVLAVLLLSPQLAPRREGLVYVGRLVAGSDKHQLSLVECGGQVLKASHNHDVILRAADYVAHHGSNTTVYMAIARIAADVEFECDRLDAVLDLALRHQSEVRLVLGLAEDACRLEDAAAEEAWQRRYDAMLATADYGSVEEALAAMRRR